MRPSTDAMAVLAVDSYVDPRSRGDDETINVDGHKFRAIKHFSEPSGYQGTVYQDEVTGYLVVAHRGTEFDKQLVKDGIVTDLGMVLVGANAQVDDAMVTTAWAVQMAEELAGDCGEIPLAVTGHSLGGTLAQITAYRYGLKGETFDSYGAAGLVADMREGGSQIINHVRATDFVSAASRHVGEVRIYAAFRDIHALESAGYANDDRRFTDLRNPLAVVAGVGVEAHYSRNFLPENDLNIGGSIVSAENSMRYEQYKPMIEKYRSDVAAIHNAFALPRNIVDDAVDRARNVLTGRDMQEQPVPLRETGCALPAAVDARDPAHPDHALYTQIHQGMKAVDASLERVPDAATERASARLFAEAKAGGLTRADHVLMSTGSVTNAAGPNLFVVQGALNDPAHLRVQVPSAEAVATAVEQSFERAAALEQKQAVQQSQQSQQVQQQEQSAPRLSM
jgi:hypothetical protein